jgi:hypothetical protein
MWDEGCGIETEDRGQREAMEMKEEGGGGGGQAMYSAASYTSSGLWSMDGLRDIQIRHNKILEIGKDDHKLYELTLTRDT